MRTTWLVTIVAGATLYLAQPAELAAQNRSAGARDRQGQVSREQERERERIRAQQRAEEERIRSQQRAEEERARSRQRPTQGRISTEEARRREAERDRSRAARDRGRYEDVYDRDRRDDDWEVYGRENRKGNGPPFCRSGAGHPTKGREWCRQKGYSVGQGRWERSRWDDILLRDPSGRYYNTPTLSRSMLLNLLGAAALNRFESYGYQSGYGSGPLSGYWVRDSRSPLLELSLGNLPIARLVDSNRDGRVDSVMLWR